MLPHKTIFTTMAAHAAAILAEGVRQAQTVGGVTPPFEMIKTSTFAYAQDVAKGWLVPGLIELFQKGVDAHVKAMGPRPQTAVDDPDNKAWCDLFDETLMDAIGQDLLRDIGQDFIGEWLTESEFDNPDTLTRAAQIAAASSFFNSSRSARRAVILSCMSTRSQDTLLSCIALHQIHSLIVISPSPFSHDVHHA